MTSSAAKKPAAKAYSLPPIGGGEEAFRPQPVPVPLPMIVRAKGIHQWDDEGKEYIDLSSGPIVSNIGHGNERVADAMAKQARTMDFAYSRVARHQPDLDISHRIASLAGPGFERVFLSSGGSEANEIAVKFLRTYDLAFNGGKRTKIITLMPSYHGGTVFTLGMTGDGDLVSWLDGFQTGCEHVPSPITYRLPGNHSPETYAAHCADELEARIRKLGPDKVLAFFMEPVGGLGTGCNVPHASYFKRVREICTKYGVALVFDEVLCGTGRTGKFLAAHNWPEALPDVVVMAKGLASGYSPLGATLFPSRMVDPLARKTGFSFSHTYSGNPVSCAAAIAVLDEYERQDIVANTAKMGAYLREGLEGLKTKHKSLGDVRGLGLCMAVEVVTDRTTKAIWPVEISPTDHFRIAGLEHGLIIYTRRTAKGRNGDWFIVAPPMNITRAECDEALKRIDATFKTFEAEMKRLGHLA